MWLQVKLRHADQEIRLAQEPFPLYPGEALKQVVTQLKVVQANTALRLRAILDFQEEDRTRKVAGDEWLFEGPGECVRERETIIKLLPLSFGRIIAGSELLFQELHSRIPISYDSLYKNASPSL